MLNKNVLIKGVTNLTEARYCAGMGVQFLCFEQTKSDENYLEPGKVLEIVQWITGPAVGLRFASMQEDMLETIEKINPDFLILTEETKHLQVNLKVFLETNHPLEGSSFDIISKNIDIIKEKESGFYDCGMSPENFDIALQEEELSGILLTGEKELRPGYISSELLMDFLEKMES